MRPIIGITTSQVHSSQIKLGYESYYLLLSKNYVTAIEKAGGTAIIIPLSQNNVLTFIELIDGLLLSGGGDISPWLYGCEPRVGLKSVNVERDLFEIRLVREAINRGIPILGICRGCQLLNVALGGTLVQDISSEIKTNIPHFYITPPSFRVHKVKLDPSSKLAKIYGTTELMVNSSHHQAVNKLGKGLKAVAWAPDGVIEGIESMEERFIIGVQWHPERILDNLQLKLFKEFIKHCKEYMKR